MSTTSKPLRITPSLALSPTFEPLAHAFISQPVHLSPPSPVQLHPVLTYRNYLQPDTGLHLFNGVMTVEVNGQTKLIELLRPSPFLATESTDPIEDYKINVLELLYLHVPRWARIIPHVMRCSAAIINAPTSKVEKWWRKRYWAEVGEGWRAETDYDMSET